MKLHDRVTRLETAMGGRDVAEVVILGGLPDADPLAHAEVPNGPAWARDAGEDAGAFRARCRAAAQAAGATALVFGGFPR